MNKAILINIIRFVSLILFQVTILNHIDFFGFINPYLYILFIVFFPQSENNRVLFLICSFLLGLSIDVFSDGGGIHAAATVFVAYIHPTIMRSVFRLSYEFHYIKIEKTHFGQRINYLFLLVFAHHLMLFSLEVFSLSHILLILKKTLFSVMFTLFLSLISITLFSGKNS